eukprot:5331367-Amphidinium_carterae.1
MHALERLTWSRQKCLSLVWHEPRQSKAKGHAQCVVQGQQPVTIGQQADLSLVRMQMFAGTNTEKGCNALTYMHLLQYFGATGTLQGQPCGVSTKDLSCPTTEFSSTLDRTIDDLVLGGKETTGVSECPCNRPAENMYRNEHVYKRHDFNTCVWNTSKRRLIHVKNGCPSRLTHVPQPPPPDRNFMARENPRRKKLARAFAETILIHPSSYQFP